jgi:hypothetical protein
MNNKKLLIVGTASILFLSGMLTAAAVIPPPPGVESDLIAGQDWNNPVGTLEVIHENGDRYLYITYSTIDGWELTETHLAVALSLSGIPQTNSGNPKVGKFPYTHPAVSEPTQVEYIIDLQDFPSLNHNGYYSGTVFIAAHAVVHNPCYGSETAWADTISQSFPGNNWALYFTLALE